MFKLYRHNGVIWLLVLPSLMIACLFILPFIMLVLEAVQSEGIVGALAVVTDPLFITALKRTLLITVIVTLVTWPCGIIYSLAMVVAKPVLRGVLLAVLLLSFWISLLIRTYGWVVLLQPSGALDTMLHWLGLVDSQLAIYGSTAAMIPAMVHIMLPFMVLPVYTALTRIDPSLLRAAQSLGAGPVFTLRKVILPQLRNGVASGLILVFVLSIGFFVTPALLGGPTNLVIATLISSEFSSTSNYGDASAMAAILLILVFVIFLIADRVFKVSRAWGEM